MKFLAILLDQGATDSFSKIAEMISRFYKERVIFRITPSSIAFISSDSLRSNGTFLQVILTAREFFSAYIMSGLSEEFNEIYMEIDKDYLFRSINIKEQSTKIRLTKIGNTPHLKVEQKTCSIVHEIPVELIPTRHWKSNDIPNISGVKAAVYFPPLATIRNLINSIKNVGAKFLAIKANRQGDLHLNGDVEFAQINVYFTDLVVSDLHISKEAAESNDIFHEVRVDIRTVHSLLRGISSNLTFSRILLRIVPEKMAVLSIDQNDISLTCVISGIIL